MPRRQVWTTHVPMSRRPRGNPINASKMPKSKLRTHELRALFSSPARVLYNWHLPPAHVANKGVLSRDRPAPWGFALTDEQATRVASRGGLPRRGPVLLTCPGEFADRTPPLLRGGTAISPYLLRVVDRLSHPVMAMLEGRPETEIAEACVENASDTMAHVSQWEQLDVQLAIHDDSDSRRPQMREEKGSRERFEERCIQTCVSEGLVQDLWFMINFGLTGRGVSGINQIVVRRRTLMNVALDLAMEHTDPDAGAWWIVRLLFFAGAAVDRQAALKLQLWLVDDNNAAQATFWRNGEMFDDLLKLCLSPMERCVNLHDQYMRMASFFPPGYRSQLESVARKFGETATHLADQLHLPEKESTDETEEALLLRNGHAKQSFREQLLVAILKDTMEFTGRSEKSQESTSTQSFLASLETEEGLAKAHLILEQVDPGRLFALQTELRLLEPILNGNNAVNSESDPQGLLQSPAPQDAWAQCVAEAASQCGIDQDGGPKFDAQVSNLRRLFQAVLSGVSSTATTKTMRSMLKKRREDQVVRRAHLQRLNSSSSDSHSATTSTTDESVDSSETSSSSDEGGDKRRPEGDQSNAADTEGWSVELSSPQRRALLATLSHSRPTVDRIDISHVVHPIHRGGRGATLAHVGLLDGWEPLGVHAALGDARKEMTDYVAHKSLRLGGRIGIHDLEARLSEVVSSALQRSKLRYCEAWSSLSNPQSSQRQLGSQKMQLVQRSLTLVRSMKATELTEDFYLKEPHIRSKLEELLEPRSLEDAADAADDVLELSMKSRMTTFINSGPILQYLERQWAGPTLIRDLELARERFKLADILLQINMYPAQGYALATSVEEVLYACLLFPRTWFNTARMFFLLDLTCDIATLAVFTWALFEQASFSFSPAYIVLGIFVAGHIVEEVREVRTGGFTEYFSSGWDILDTCLYLNLLVVFLLKFLAQSLELSNPGDATGCLETAQVLMAIGSVGQWTRMLNALSIDSNLGPLLTVMANMVVSILVLLALIFMVLAGFATMMYALFADSRSFVGVEGFTTLPESFITLIGVMLGDMPLDSFIGQPTTFRLLGQSLIGVFVIIGALILFNLILAVVLENYRPDEVQDEFRFQRAKLTRTYERNVDLNLFPPPLNLIQAFCSTVLPSVERSLYDSDAPYAAAAHPRTLTAPLERKTGACVRTLHVIANTAASRGDDESGAVRRPVTTQGRRVSVNGLSAAASRGQLLASSGLAAKRKLEAEARSPFRLVWETFADMATFRKPVLLVGSYELYKPWQDLGATEVPYFLFLVIFYPFILACLSVALLIAACLFPTYYTATFVSRGSQPNLEAANGQNHGRVLPHDYEEGDGSGTVAAQTNATLYWQQAKIIMQAPLVWLFVTFTCTAAASLATVVLWCTMIVRIGYSAVCIARGLLYLKCFPSVTDTTAKATKRVGEASRTVQCYFPTNIVRLCLLRGSRPEANISSVASAVLRLKKMAVRADNVPVKPRSQPTPEETRPSADVASAKALADVRREMHEIRQLLLQVLRGQVEPAGPGPTLSSASPGPPRRRLAPLGHLPLADRSGESLVQHPPRPPSQPRRGVERLVAEGPRDESDEKSGSQSDEA